MYVATPNGLFAVALPLTSSSVPVLVEPNAAFAGNVVGEGLAIDSKGQLYAGPDGFNVFATPVRSNEPATIRFATGYTTGSPVFDGSGDLIATFQFGGTTSFYAYPITEHSLPAYQDETPCDYHLAVYQGNLYASCGSFEGEFSPPLYNNAQRVFPLAPEPNNYASTEQVIDAAGDVFLVSLEFGGGGGELIQEYPRAFSGPSAAITIPTLPGQSGTPGEPLSLALDASGDLVVGAFACAAASCTQNQAELLVYKTPLTSTSVPFAVVGGFASSSAYGTSFATSIVAGP